MKRIHLKDRLLWRDVTKDIAPYRTQAEIKDEAPEIVAEDIKDPAFTTGPRKKPRFGKGVGIDRNTEEKLRRGKMPIDGTLDLHGMTQAEAHSALQRFILGSLRHHKRCLLIVTGKGRMGEGVLRQAVPRWLKDDDLAPYILSVQKASARDGGDGAIYVLLRRARD